LPKIYRQITKDINQLQAFAEAHPIGNQLCFIQRGLGKKMSPAELRPEFAHATRDTISIVVQFRVRFQGEDFAGCSAAKSLKIERLASRDRLKHLAHSSLVGRIKAIQQ